MRFAKKLAWAWLVVLLACAQTLLPAPKALAASPPPLITPSGLSFAQIGITGSNEFVVIQNNTAGQVDLGTYWIYQHNNYNPLAAGATTSTEQLPSAKLDPGQTLLLSANAQTTCAVEIAGRLSVSLVDGSGSLELLNSSIVGGATVIASADTDFVSWSSSTNGNIQNVAAATPQPVYYRYQSANSPPAFAWQKAAFDTTSACQLNVASFSSPSVSTASLIAASAIIVPATIVVASSSSGGGIPASDDGLAGPVISELLPNPAGTGNDTTDEFVELYNPNAQAFDLSGFTIESGLTTKHDYTFDDGTSLPAKSFTAFYSVDTGLTLSNTGSQAWLLDPNGNIVSQTDSYSSAKDGLAWALAGSVWYWTSTPTPGAANLINGVAASTVAKSKTHTTPTTGSASADSGSGSSNSSLSGSNSTSLPTAAVHPWTLAGVGGAALLYAGYEYRNDLANNLYRLRRYAQARRAAGK